MSLTYTLRYKPIDADTWTEVPGLTGTSHQVTGLTAGVRYDVEVVAVSSGASSTPLAAKRSTRCAPPTQPTVTPAGYALSDDSGTNGALAASWSAVTGAVSYEVRRRLTTPEPGSYETVGTVPAPTTSLSMTGLDGTASYDLEVAAINDDDDVSDASTARTNVPARIASGGTVTLIPVVGTPKTHVVHTFTTVGSNTFVLNRDRTVDYLIVAGGGGGGSDNAGGGGGGGVLADSGLVVPANSTLEVVVGAGGAPSGNNNKNDQTNGGNSSFSGLTAIGGGQGGNGEPGARARTAGGSGGGGHGERFGVDGAPTINGAAGTPGQGFGGGNGNRSATVGWGDGGGGGGAGAPGEDAAPLPAGPGDGGIGLASDITGTNHFYGSGGGGGTERGTIASQRSGAGGTRSGGGGGGALGNVNGGDGENEFGGGGGGSATTAFSGGAGGSGTVILRYALP